MRGTKVQRTNVLGTNVRLEQMSGWEQKSARKQNSSREQKFSVEQGRKIQEVWRTKVTFEKSKQQMSGRESSLENKFPENKSPLGD